ncbi:MAG: PAS domain S-box protein, partial [Patescibacteria group bacterium]|nr:PAS domain S-box protein [Patescibacteria group bacterium]
MNNCKNSEKDFLDFFDNVPDGVLLVDIKTKKFYSGNKAICRLLGRSRKEFKKLRVKDIHPQAVLPRVLSYFDRLAKREISLAKNIPVKRKSGRIFYADINVSAPVMVDGKKLMIGFFRDVTSRKRAEEELAASKQRLADLVNFLPDATMAINLAGRVIAWNRKIEQMTGVKKNEILGKDNYLYAVPFYGKRRPVLMDLVLKRNKKIAKKYPYIQKEKDQLISEIFIPLLYGGKGAYLWCVASPLYDENGKLAGAIESVRDITDRKLAEQELSKSRERFKNLVDLLPQTVFEMDKNGKLTFVNHYGLATFGYAKKDLAQKKLKILELIAKEDRTRAAKMILERIKTRKIGANEYLAVRKDGNTFPALVYSSYAVQENKMDGIRGILVDLTSIKKVEQSLKEIAAKDEALLGSIADGVIAVNKEGKIILINQAALKMLGYTEEETMGKKWFDVLHKEDEKGNKLPLEKSDFAAVLKTGQTFSAITPYYYVGKRGKKFPVSRAVAPVILGGETIGAINVFRDITEEKALDQAKSDFLSLASHQLRTPLSASKWILETMSSQTQGLSDKQKRYLRDLAISNELLIGLVNGLLDVARIEAGRLSIYKKSVDILAL